MTKFLPDSRVHARAATSFQRPALSQVVLLGAALAVTLLVSFGWTILSSSPSSAQENPRVFITEAPTVIINEVHASNLSGDQAEDDNFEDWIELYNVSNQPLDLTGWGLSNNDKNPFRWTFPPGSTIASGQYLRVWASKSDRIADLDELHTNFNIDHGEDEVVLSAPNLTDDGIVVDMVVPPRTLADTSWCRTQSGNPSAPFAHCTTPTLAEANEGPFFAEMVEGVPTIDVASGIYGSAVTTTVTGPAGATLRYTLDGSIPTEESPVVTGPLTISATGPLRVGAFETGKLPSHPATATYRIDTSGTFDGQRVLFVTLDPSGERSYLGNSRSSDEGWIGNVEMIDEDGTHAFNADAAMGDAGRIGSRRSQDTYPLAINFREALGQSSVKYEIFGDKPGVDSFKKLRLRNSGLDYHKAHVRDQFWQSFAPDWNVAGAAFEPVSLFVNGEYQGFMDLREREDESLIESTHGVERDYVQYWSEGESKQGDNTEASFEAMEDFVKDNDLSDQALYEQATTMVDPEALAAYFVTYSFHHEEDSMWRNDQAYTAPGLNDAWRLRPHDVETGGDGGDIGFNGDYDKDPAEQYSSHEFPSIFKEMLDNAEFRQYYIQMTADGLNTVLSPASGQARIAAMADPMEKYIVPHVEWSNDIPSVSSWREEIALISNFFERRAPYFTEGQEDYFDLSPRVDVNIDVNSAAMGSIDVNSINTAEWANADGTWDAKYYPNVALPLTAVPNLGYEFVRWEGSVSGNDRSISPNPTNGATYKAIFAPVAENSVPVIESALPDRADETGDLVSLYVEAMDPRGYPITFDEKKLPKGLDFHPESGRIYGKLNRACECKVKILVNNGQEEVEETFIWTVTPRNNRETSIPVGVGGVGTGMVATYFDNETLAGDPALTRNEVPSVSVGGGSGVLPGFGTSDWTIGWEGTMESPIAGIHTLQTITRSDDGVRVFVDGELVIDQWAGGTTNDTVDVDFALNELKQVRVEFIDLSSSAELQLNWRVPGSSVFQAVPGGVMNAGTPVIPTPTPVPPTPTPVVPTPTPVTPVATPVPGQGLTCSVNAGAITWTDAGKSKYWIYKSTPANPTFTWIGRSLGGTTFTDPAPVLGAEYQVRYAEARPFACTIEAEPANPGGPFSCSNNDGALTWTDAGESRYWIYRSTDGGETFSWIGRSLGGTSFTDPNPAAGAVYQVHYAGIPRVVCDSI